ncbi:MAG TPA: hypothetical protein VME23_08060 [Terracidiphilus sp.]|nr:hypothetical protein [Terracidiphilus sp.]
MATFTTAHSIVPLQLAGNTTEQQNAALQQYLAESIQAAYRTAIEELDRQSVESVLESQSQLKSEIIGQIVDAIQRHAVSNKYLNEAVGSDRGYPANYRVRPVEAQTTGLRTAFPKLGSCIEKLARLPLPEGAEGWFAIPRWQALAPTYNEAVEMMLETLGKRRRFSNRIAGRLSDVFLRQTARSRLADEILADQQPGNDILVVAAQAGMLHRGSSARRTRAAMAGNEFGLGVFAFAAMVLTHPERLSSSDTLMVDCCGDEYSIQGDSTFDRIPLFDFDVSGIEFSIFYEDRARNLWGSPTGFLYKIV